MPYEPQGELESENTTVNVDIENADLVDSLLEAEETQAVTDQVTEMAQQDPSTAQPQTKPQTEKTNPFKVDNPEGTLVGPDAYKDTNRFPEGPWCKEKDWVIFGRYAGSRLSIEGGEIRILNDDEILATIENPEDILHLY